MDEVSGQELCEDLAQNGMRESQRRRLLTLLRAIVGLLLLVRVF